MNPRPRVLVSAFSCHPQRGSEPGVGHLFVSTLAKHCDLTVLTEEVGNRAAIEERQKSDPLYASIDFHFIKWPRLDRAGNRIDDRGSLHFYRCLRQWERQAFELATTLTTARRFDLTHHLTMQGYREPGYLWQLPLPFIWGPVGGHGQMPWRYLTTLGWKGCLQNTVRNVANLIQARIDPRVARAARSAACVICNTSGGKEAFRKLHGVDATVIGEFGAEVLHAPARTPLNGRAIQIAWSGVHVPRKGLPILLHALARLGRRVPFEVQILSDGPETRRWQNLASHLGVADRCVWHGRLSRAHALNIMGRCDLFALTSLLDGTSCVLNEAIALGLPVICHRACGFADIVDETCGVLVDPASPRHSAEGFTRGIELLASDERLYDRLAAGARAKASQISVEQRATRMLEVYERVLRRTLCEDHDVPALQPVLT